MRPRSLRTRLVAATLLLLAVTSAVVAVVTAVSLRRFLVGRLDDDLRGASRAFERYTGPDGSPPDPNRPGAGPPALPGLFAEAGEGGPPRLDSLFARIEGGTVRGAVVTERLGDWQPVPTPEYPDLLAVVPGNGPTSIDLGDLGSYRVVASSGAGGVFLTGLSERRLQETLAQLITVELGVTAVALIGAGVVGTFVVRRELRPLERVAATAARVSALPLDRGEVSLAERVPDVDPRTEVGQVGAALNRMLDHVGSALAARQDSETQLRQFVADASHELRTPLAAIRGYAELSRRGDLTEETEYSLVRISSQAERMTTLVEDLLLLARLDAGRPLERNEVDLTRLVVDAVGDAHTVGPDHRWQLDLPEEPVTLSGDGSRLAQVLANLLANARTHTPPGTVVTVSLARTGDGVVLSVVDGGPGIAPELLPHVFERFARGSSSRSRRSGSTGLGLSIVDAVVAAHGGSVAVASVPGRTGFTVTLPAVPGPAEPACRRSSTAPSCTT